MAITINLPSGQTVVMDENTGSIISALPGGDGGPPALEPPPSEDTAPTTTTARTTTTRPTTSTAGPGGFGGVTPTAQAQLDYQRAALAEQQRQFDETFGFEKAKYNTSTNIDKGKTLLSLGSRPDTLIKYLYALRGQQVPQGFENTTQNLPGFENILNPGTRTGTAGGGTGGSAVGPAPQIPVSSLQPGGGNVVDLRGVGGTAENRPKFAEAPIIPAPPLNTTNMPSDAKLGVGPGNQAISLSDWAIKNLPQVSTTGTNAAQTTTSTYNPNTDPNRGTMFAGASGFNTDGTLRLAANDPDAARLMAANPGKYRIGFADGGVIPEPVIGIGLRSGQTYTFGEEGPEEVEPAKKPYTNSGTGSFAYGGTIGYNPRFAPPDLFNPSGLAGNIAGPLNPNGNPNFPQFNHFTGGGESLIPSAQRLNNSLGSERSLYAGFLQDEAGVVPEDVFELARKLAPQVTGLRTPKFAN